MLGQATTAKTEGLPCVYAVAHELKHREYSNQKSLPADIQSQRISSVQQAATYVCRGPYDVTSGNLLSLDNIGQNLSPGLMDISTQGKLGRP